MSQLLEIIQFNLPDNDFTGKDSYVFLPIITAFCLFGAQVVVI